MISLLGIYRPRSTPMHAAPAWAKAALIAIVAIVTMISDDPVTSVGIAAASMLLLISTGPPVRATVRGLAFIAVVAALSVGFHVWRGDYERAVDTAADLIAIAAIALAITSSTPMEAMLDLASHLFRPLRRVIPPETMGLMFALTLRAIPEVARILTESRNAAKARGLDRSLRAILVPTTTRTVGFALQLGQALHARGIAEEAHAPPPRKG